MTRLVNAFVLCGVLLAAGTTLAADLSGNYIAQVTTSPTAEKQYARVTLKVDGAAVIGVWGDRKVAGSLAGNTLTLTLTDAAGGSAGALEGTVTGASLAGDGMSDSEVALFVGAVMKYDIAELVDPHINVVAKVPKTALASFKK